MEDTRKEIQKLEGIIEAILFAMGDSVEASKIAAAIGHDESTVCRIIRNMMDKYAAVERGIRIIETENAMQGTSFQMCTKPEMYEHLIKITSQPKKYALTDVQLETLSIIAYRQPVTKLEISSIRGVNCDHSVNRLMEYNLVTDVGRLDAPGRPLLFGTTDEFLKRFGVRSIEELPGLPADMAAEFRQEAMEEIQLKLDI